MLYRTSGENVVEDSTSVLIFSDHSIPVCMVHCCPSRTRLSMFPSQQPLHAAHQHLNVNANTGLATTLNGRQTSVKKEQAARPTSPCHPLFPAAHTLCLSEDVPSLSSSLSLPPSVSSATRCSLGACGRHRCTRVRALMRSQPPLPQLPLLLYSPPMGQASRPPRRPPPLLRRRCPLRCPSLRSARLGCPQ